MATCRKVALRVVTLFAVISFVIAGVWFFLKWTASQTLQSVNLDPLVTISKKVLADSVVLKQGSASSSTVPKGYLVAYEQNSASFKADAKLFDTWVRAIALTDSVLENGPAGNWV